jgi:WD40 repeat protein
MAFVAATGVLPAGGCGGESAATREPQPAVVTIAEPEQWFDFDTAAPQPLAAQPGGRRAVVQAGCETILYDLETQERLYAWNDFFLSASYSQDGRYLLTVQHDNVTVWDGDSGAEVRRFEGRPPAWNEPNYQSRITIAALSDDGALVAIANCKDSFSKELPAAVLVYDTHTGQLGQTLATAEKTDISSLQFLSQGRRLLVAYKIWREGERGKRIYILWSTEQGEKVVELPGGVARRSPDGRWVATSRWEGVPSFGGIVQPGSKSTCLTLWDADSGEEVRRFEHDCAHRDFTFRPDSERILAALVLKRIRDGKAAFEGRLIEWDVESGEVRFTGAHGPKPYAKVAYSPDGARRFACTEEPNGVDDDVDHFLVGWNTKTGERLPMETYRFASYNGYEELFFYPKGDRFIDLSADFEVRDVLTGKQVLALPEYRGPVSRVAFVPGESVLLARDRFISAQVGPNARLLDYLSGEHREVRLHGRGATFLDSGRTLFTCDSNRLCLTDAATEEITGTMPMDRYYRLLAVAVSRDAKHVAMSKEVNDDEPSPARLILITASRPFDPMILKRYASALAFHPDGTRFIAASPEAIEEIDAKSGEPIRTFCSPPGRPMAIAYRDDGQQVLACGVLGHADPREPVDSTDQGWAMLSSTESEQAMTLEGHTAPVTTAVFSPDGTRCVTGSMDKTIRLWDTAAGRELHVFRGHLGPVYDVAYSPLADRVVSAAADGAAMWDVARFATPPIEAAPLADAYTTTESSLVGDVSTTSDAEAIWASIEGTATWPLIEFGKADREDLPEEIQYWLSQTKVVEHGGELPPPEKLAGRRRVYIPRSEPKIILEDENGERLHAWGRENPSWRGKLSPSEKEVVISHEERSDQGEWYELDIYDAKTGELSRVIREDHPDFNGAFTIDPLERTILMHVGREGLVLRDYQTGAKLGSYAGYASWGDRAYSGDGRYIVTSCFPWTWITLHDPMTLAVEKRLSNWLPSRGSAICPDEKRLLAAQHWADLCHLLTMWDIESGQRLWTRVGPAAASSEFSRDGRRLLRWYTYHRPCLATLWDADTGDVVCAVLTPDTEDYKPVLGDDGRSIHLGTPDGPRLWPRR